MVLANTPTYVTEPRVCLAFPLCHCTADATRRGLGTKMLDKPAKLERLVSEIAAATALPLTVKIRTGQNASKINVHKARTFNEVLRSCGIVTLIALPMTVKIRTGQKNARKGDVHKARGGQMLPGRSEADGLQALVHCSGAAAALGDEHIRVKLQFQRTI